MKEKSNKYLERGKVYQFLIERIDKEYTNSYILCDEFGTKHLLSLSDYHEYAYEPGKKIKCKVSKINCSGKIFLEPEHPVYAEGQTFSFQVVSFLPVKLLDKNPAFMLTVVDYFGNKFEVPALRNVGNIDLVVSKLHKGKPVLVNPEIPKELFYRKDAVYRMEIAGMDEDKIYFRDRYSNKYSISYPIYAHFEYRIGKKVWFYVRYNDLKDIQFEPINPDYELGESYDFEYGGILRDHKSENDASEVHFAIDSFGKKALINYRTIENSKFPAIGESIRCEVIRYKKGTLVLSY